MVKQFISPRYAMGKFIFVPMLIGYSFEISGLWNYVFLLANSSVFIFLPFAYLFSESSGFVGHKKGVISRVYETFVVLTLLAVVVLGMTYVISAVIDPERSGFQTLMSKLHDNLNSFQFSYHFFSLLRFRILLSTILILMHFIFGCGCFTR